MMKSAYQQSDNSTTQIQNKAQSLFPESH